MAVAPGFYNAVIRDDLKILGRTHLTDPKNMHWWWEIQDWNGKEILTLKDLQESISDPHKHPAEELPVHPEKLLQITKRKSFFDKVVARFQTNKKLDLEFQIIFPANIDDTDGVPLRVSGSDTLEEVRWMISKEMGVEEPPLWGLALGKTMLWDKLHCTLQELGVSAENNRFRYLRSSEIPGNKLLSKGNATVSVARKVGQRTDVYNFKLWTYTRVGQLKYEIWNKMGIPVKEQELTFDDIPLNNDYKTLQELSEVEIDEERPVAYLIRVKRAEEPQFGNEESYRVMIGEEGEGVVAGEQDLWRAYGPGLNLKGSCENPACKSNSATTKDPVIVTFESGKLFAMKPDWLIQCTACLEDTFKPTSFLISGATCSFQYKLPGDRMIKLVDVGSNGPFPKMVAFEHPEDKANYELVVVRVVPWNHSPHDCLWCGKRIGSKEEEVRSSVEGCEHHWHKQCMPDEVCAICTAKDIPEAELTQSFQ